MVVNPIPPRHSSLVEALQRARNKWMLREAWDKLLGLLISEELVASIVGKNAKPRKLNGDFWREKWTTVDIEHGVIREYPDMEGEARVVFLTADLDEKIPWPEQKAERTEANAAQAAPTNKVGAPLQHDWDAMWIEAVRIALYDKFPDKAAVLRRRLHDWFGHTARSIPGETAMKEKMRALFEMIDSEEKKGGN